MNLLPTTYIQHIDTLDDLIGMDIKYNLINPSPQIGVITDVSITEDTDINTTDQLSHAEHYDLDISLTVKDHHTGEETTLHKDEDRIGITEPRINETYTRHDLEGLTEDGNWEPIYQNSFHILNSDPLLESEYIRIRTITKKYRVQESHTEEHNIYIKNGQIRTTPRGDSTFHAATLYNFSEGNRIDVAFEPHSNDEQFPYIITGDLISVPEELENATPQSVTELDERYQLTIRTFDGSTLTISYYPHRKKATGTYKTNSAENVKELEHLAKNNPTEDMRGAIIGWDSQNSESYYNLPWMKDLAQYLTIPTEMQDTDSNDPNGVKIGTVIVDLQNPYKVHHIEIDDQYQDNTTLTNDVSNVDTPYTYYVDVGE